MRASSPKAGSRGGSRSASRGKDAKGGKGKKKSIGPPPTYETYAERTIWSQRFKGWTKYDVKKPRLARPDDNLNWVENFVGRPATFSALSGTHNDTVVRSLLNFAEQFEKTKNLQDLLIIYGPSGTGKSVMAQIFVQELLDRIELPATLASKWCLYVDAKKYNDRNYHELWKLIKDHLEAPQDKAIKVPLKLVLIDDADTIPATHQNTIKTMLDKNSLKLKWIFTAHEPRKFIQFLQTKGMQLKCKNPSEKEALVIMLLFCQKFKIGYERAGIHTIFELNRDNNLSLSKMVNMLQATFVKTHFISEENVFKCSNKKPPAPVIGPYAAIEPFPRCRICTLFPPCAHRPQAELIEQGQKQREAYPDYVGQGRPVCPEFARTGCCTVFNTHKRCNLAHPKRLHTVLLPVIRCPLCTIAWPCQKCDYSSDRNELLDLIENIETRIELLKVLNVKEPPVHLVIHLAAEFEDWDMRISAIAKFYLTSEKQATLTETKEWVATERSVLPHEYEWKRSHLNRTYGELVQTPLLKDRRPQATSRGRSRQTATPGSRMDELGSVGSGADDAMSLASVTGGGSRDARSLGSGATAKSSKK
jgi:hypothetical protein